MKNLKRLLTAPLIGSLLIAQGMLDRSAMAQPTQPPLATKAISKLDDQKEWLDHFENNILRFWVTPEALGVEAKQAKTTGNFPTWRCNDGSIFNDRTNACREIVNAPLWVTNHRHLDYLRMKSRQTYLYGVAFNITGQDKYLEWMRAGINFIVSKGLIDHGKGGAYTFWKNGSADDLGLARNSQDLSYVMLSMTYYYYLTGDPSILVPIKNLKDYIFKTYTDKSHSSSKQTCLKWTASAPPAGEAPPYNTDESHKLELVSQLDQANAYLLLGSVVLPEPMRQEWRNDLRALVHCMRNDYLDQTTGLFWGAIDLPRQRQIGGHKHNDFGHTVKTYWTMYLAARILGDQELKTFARNGGLKILNWAYDPKDGAWNSRPLPRPGFKTCTMTGSTACPIDTNRDWWIYAELDQGAATLTLEKVDPKRNWLGDELPRTQAYWRQNFFDKTYGDVWHRITVGSVCDPNLRNEEDSCLPKVHFYKNGFHVPEHVLVGYLTGSAYKGKPVSLFFATPSCAKLRPYTPYNLTGQAHVDSCNAFAEQPLTSSGLMKVKVTFSGIH